MLKCYPDVIKCALNKWESHGIIRYYYDKWPKYLDQEDASRYHSQHGVLLDDFNDGIRVFFDENGILHIDNCLDSVIRAKIEYGMDKWYYGALKLFKTKHSGERRIMDLIGPYTSEIKPGYYQVRYGNAVFNFDESQRKWMEVCGYVSMDWKTGKESIHTEYHRLNEIIWDIIQNSNNEGVGYSPSDLGKCFFGE